LQFAWECGARQSDFKFVRAKILQRKSRGEGNWGGGLCPCQGRKFPVHPLRRLANAGRHGLNCFRGQIDGDP
jgi:hypothetical protein